MSDAEVAAFLAQERTVTCATIGPRGWPHLMPLWYVVREPPHGAPAPRLWSWTYAASQKVRNVEREPRATLQVEAGESYEELRGVMLECDVDMERDPTRVADYGRALFRRYGGAGEDGELVPDVERMIEKQATKRVGLRFKPTRTVSWDHGKLGGAY